MALQKSVVVRNAQLDAIETAIGAGAILKIRTGAAPADVANWRRTARIRLEKVL